MVVLNYIAVLMKVALNADLGATAYHNLISVNIFG